MLQYIQYDNLLSDESEKQQNDCNALFGDKKFSKISNYLRNDIIHYLYRLLDVETDIAYHEANNSMTVAR
ncbi:MAG: hypothetical protein MRJ93_11590 [Nitrososphaeraceae archaeon]|nr:hypothetical protein [Nitrososphaeraceae archaeon]